ncbi:MAG: hypothetical protein ACOC9Z_07760 [Chloroflexota bacterium]
MARKKPDDRLKRALLLAFITVSVVLIIGIYGTALSNRNESGTAFYRSAPVVTPDESWTAVAPVEENVPTGEATSTPSSVEYDPGSHLLDDN